MPTNVKLKIKSGKQHGEEHEGGHGLDPYVIEVRLTNKMLLPPVYQLVKEMFKIKGI